jgi:spore germination protein KB
LNIKQGHIDGRQATAFLWLAASSKILLTIPALLVGEGFSASWLIPLGSATIAAVAVLPGLALMKRFPGRSLAGAAEEAVGPIAGRAAGLVLAAFLATDAALVLRQFSDAFGIVILPRTPIPVITLVLVLAAAYSAYTGLESIGRLSMFLVPWLLAFFALGYAGRSPDLSIARLLPFWGPGPGNLAVQALEHTGLYSELLTLLILIPYLRKPAVGRAVAFWVIGLTAAVMILFQVAVLVTFDVLGSEQLLYPVIHLSHLVTFGRLDVRLEPVVVLLWIFMAAVKVSVILWTLGTHLAETLRLPQFKPLLPIVAVIALAGSRLPGGLPQTIELYHESVTHVGGVAAFALPGLLWLAAVLRGRRAA